MTLRNSNIRTLFWLIAGCIAMSSSCKKPVKQPVTEDKKGITLDFYSLFAGQPIAFKTGEYTRTNGEIMRFTNLALILSKVSLIKSDDSKVLLGDGYLFVDFIGKKTSFNFPTVPAGDYKAIS